MFLKKRVLSQGVGVLVVLALLAFAGSAWAAGLNIEVTGNPTSVQQGQTKNFTINVSANGKINKNLTPATVSIDTEYTAGGQSANPDNRSTFTYVCTTKCDTQAQPVSGETYAIPALVIVPVNLAVGTYKITISAFPGTGLTLPDPMPSFDIEVTPAALAPTVTINSPENGGTYKVNQPIDAGVDIKSDLPVTISASLNGVAFQLIYDTEKLTYTAPLVLSKPGENIVSVRACNEAGCSTETSTFTVKYDFGGWLPPITTAKFQAGRTLPVKFRMNDYYGPTANAVAAVTLDGVFQGLAAVMYDSNNVPFYQLEIKLDVAVPAIAGASTSASVGLSLDDGATSASKAISIR